MENRPIENKYSEVKAAIILAIILLAGMTFLLYFSGFFTKPTEKCDNSHMDLCNNKNICEQQNFFWWENSCHLEKETILPSDYPDWNSALGMKTLELAKDFQTFTPNSVPNSKYNIYISFSQKGEISKGYIEIIASIDNKPLTKWESLFMKINYNSKDYKINGGHLFRPLSLKLPREDKTHLLYALNDVPYLDSVPYDETRAPSHSDWFRYFKNGNKNDFMAFISSLSPAKIDLVKIYYECQNGSDCSLTLSN